MHRAVTFAALGFALASAAARAQGVPPVPVPPGNPITPSKANLGKVLFWDEQLSSTRTVACGTCHAPARGGADPRTLAAPGALHPGFDLVFGTADDVRGSPGVVHCAAGGGYSPSAVFGLAPQVTSRKAPSMINAAFSPTLFWDGRANASFEDPVTGTVVLLANAALESQAAGPPVSDVEMAHEGRDWLDVVDRIAGAKPLALAEEVPPALLGYVGGRSYPELFAEAFGSPGVTAARTAMALATYQRTLVSNQSPFDQFQAGIPGVLSPLEVQGLLVFNGPGRCSLCHGGPLFTNNSFQALGVRPPAEDLGRGAITGLPADAGKFKVPGLRNVGLRAPYFHNGSQPTLAGVVEFYDRGGDFLANQSPLIQPLGLTPQQKNALVAFLANALTDPRAASELPPFDRPALYSDSERVPATFGAAAAGSGGVAPRWVALEPALLGSPAFTFAVERGLGGAPAFLGLDLSASAPGTLAAGIPFHLAGTSALQLLALGTLAGSGAGGGFLSLTAALPAAPALDGVALFLQAFVLDPAGKNGLAATNGLTFGFFAGL